MGTVWIPGAERLGDGDIGGDMDTPERPPRVVWHTTESGAGNEAFQAVGSYLSRVAAEPHILYDPYTDHLGQYGPLNQSARALRNDGSSRTNRTGRVCIQIEVLAYAGMPFTAYWKPGKNFRALMDAIRSWGVPDRFPLPLADRYGEGVRTRDVWLNQAGHYGHCNVPGNDHWDPGAIDTAKLFAAAPKEDDDMDARDVWWYEAKYGKDGKRKVVDLLRDAQIEAQAARLGVEELTQLVRQLRTEVAELRG